MKAQRNKKAMPLATFSVLCNALRGDDRMNRVPPLRNVSEMLMSNE